MTLQFQPTCFSPYLDNDFGQIEERQERNEVLPQVRALPCLALGHSIAIKIEFNSIDLPCSTSLCQTGKRYHEHVCQRTAFTQSVSRQLGHTMVTSRCQAMRFQSPHSLYTFLAKARDKGASPWEQRQMMSFLDGEKGGK